MAGLRAALFAFLGLSAITLITSCASIQKTAGRESKAVDDAITQAQMHLARGDYKKALEAYDDAYGDYPRSAELRGSYIRAGEQIKAAVDAAFQKKEFAEAGSGYTTLLKSTLTDKNFAGALSFDTDHLNKRIQACSKGLLETGLVQYRQGKLDQAISLWRKAITFDPDNKEAKDAISTATVQLQNLKNIK
ncbi:MAG TPA: tetratricopeptide repeat protein [Nitrospirota bacterium]|nr:tetratricopeptide repeat protein [Nitrospirota bacterium]